MKLYRRIWIEQDKFPPPLYQTIIRLKPECQEGDHFRLECQPGDEQAAALAEQIVALCKRQGLRQTAGGEPGTYGYDVVRHYAQADLDAAPLLLLDTQRRMLQNASRRDESGKLCVPANQVKTRVKVASIYPTHWVVVSEVVKETLERAGLIGLEFRAVALKGSSIHAPREPLWELCSSLTLPKMANAVPIEGRPFACYGIDDPPYRGGEPHYRQSDLQAIGAFDIAYTFEPLGEPRPALIVSQRFYQHCIANKIPLEVRPVRIDPA